MTQQIVDYTGYNNEMAKSLEDKLFFLKEIPDFNSIFDFGCGDGLLLSSIYCHNKIGYDNNEKELRIASGKQAGHPFQSFFSNSFDECVKKVKGTSILVLNSVLHEIYSYLTPEQITKFWSDIFSAKFNYIVIRDMCDYSYANKVTEYEYANLHKFANSKQLYDFEKEWGSVIDAKNMMHFLLKYRYIYNWDREVKENYLSYTKDTVSEEFRKQPYTKVYEDNFILPFLKAKVLQDFSINVNYNTHIKLIYKLAD